MLLGIICLLSALLPAALSPSAKVLVSLGQPACRHAMAASMMAAPVVAASSKRAATGYNQRHARPLHGKIFVSAAKRVGCRSRRCCIIVVYIELGVRCALAFEKCLRTLAIGTTGLPEDNEFDALRVVGATDGFLSCRDRLNTGENDQADEGNS